MTQRSPRRFSANPHFWPRLLLAAAVILYAAYFSWLTITRYAAFESRALDMGNLHQAFWNTAHGNWFHQTNQPGATNRLNLHVEPILLLIAAFYRLFPSVEALLVLQSTIVALGAVALYAIGEKRLKSAWLALLFAVAWLMMPALQSANWLEFHPVTLAPTFLLAAFYFLLERRIGWYAFFAVLAAACKEDMGLLVAMMGLYALVALHMRWLGIVTMALGVGWSLVAVLGIQQQFGGNIHWGRYAWLGVTTSEKFRTLVAQPGVLLAHLQQADAGGYLFKMLLPVGFLALLAPEVLLLALPSLGINLLADFPPMQQIDGLIYAAPIAPFVALAAVLGSARLLRWLRRDEAGNAARRTAPWVLGALVMGGALAAQAFHGYLPGGANYRRYEITDHHRRAESMIAKIAPDDRVSAQDRLNAHVSGRETAYIFPERSNGDAPPANTVLVDVTGPSWPIHPNDVHAQVQSLLADGWGIAAADDGYLLLREGELNQTLPPAFFTPWQAAATPPSTPLRARFDDALELTGVDVDTDAHGEVVVRLDMHTLGALDQKVTPRLIARDATGVTLYDSLYYPPVAALWYPSTMWPPGEPVSVHSLPWTPSADRFTLYLSLHAGDDPGAAGLPVQVDDPARMLLDGDTLLRVGGYERTGNRWREVAPPAPLPATLDARFGDRIRLEAGAVEVDEGVPATATVSLQWQADTTPEADYTVFVHVLNAAGEKVAQLDTPPRDALGPLPATAWTPDSVLLGEYPVPLPEGLPAGEYTVIAGMYDWRSGERLAVTEDDARPDNSVVVGTFVAP